jgi:glycosyltransferase involved in cell wall biosynthesis
MKLLVVSHACIAPVNQSFYAEVAKLTGWEVSLVIPSRWNSEYESGLRVTRWPEFTGEIRPLPVCRPGNIPLHFYKSSFLGELRRAKPDAIYMHHEPYGLATAQVYAANRLTGRCPIGFYAAQNIDKTYPIPFRWFEAGVLQHSDFCFPVTQGALDVLREKGYGGVAEVLPLAVDRAIYTRRAEAAAGLRTSLGIGVDEFVVGYLGRLVEEKGLRSLIDAVRGLGELPWRCVLVGTGGYEPELRAQVARLGLEQKVIFAGYVPHEQAPVWLSLFDVLALASEARPSWKEQFGRVIVEANACGTAVVGTESGEIGNVLRTTGGGIVVPEADTDALGEALAKLMREPEHRRSLAEAGLRVVRELYDQTNLARRFASVIGDAVERRRKRVDADRTRYA